jgi:hypothetical protein
MFDDSPKRWIRTTQEEKVMNRFFVRSAALAIALATLAAVPAAAQVIKKGIDYWRTPASGTKFKFPDKDVESLCKATPDPSWNHEVSLRGIPAQGSDWDSAVARLDDANVGYRREAVTRVQFRSMAMISNGPSDTPCGKLIWIARLDKHAQPITKMKIVKKSAKGGSFSADLALRVEIQANRADTGAYVGSLFYDIKLPDPGGSTPWSLSASNVFRPGMTEANDCIQVLRDKLGTFPPGSDHIYFISDLIARGECRKQG